MEERRSGGEEGCRTVQPPLDCRRVGRHLGRSDDTPQHPPPTTHHLHPTPTPHNPWPLYTASLGSSFHC